MDPAITSYLDAHSSDAQLLLERLCRQPSIAAQNVGIVEMADLVESLLRETGFQTQRLLAQGAPPVVYGELRGRSDYAVLLYNHYDVQPASRLNSGTRLLSSQPCVMANSLLVVHPITRVKSLLA